MLVLAEVKLNNCSFTQENPVTTVEEVDLKDLGESYVAIHGEVYLKKVLPISQASIEFKIDCLERNILHTQRDIDFVISREASIREDVDSGRCKPEWAISYLEDYTARTEEYNSQLKTSQEMLELYKKYIIVKD